MIEHSSQHSKHCFRERHLHQSKMNQQLKNGQILNPNLNEHHHFLNVDQNLNEHLHLLNIDFNHIVLVMVERKTESYWNNYHDFFHFYFYCFDSVQCCWKEMVWYLKEGFCERDTESHRPH